MPALCRATTYLPTEVQAQLALAWSGPGRKSMRSILENLQQLITLRVILSNIPNIDIQDDNVITSATKLMKVVYYSNILAGVMESPDLREDYVMDDSYNGLKLSRTQLPPDPLGGSFYNFIFRMNSYLYFSYVTRHKCARLSKTLSTLFGILQRTSKRRG